MYSMKINKFVIHKLIKTQHLEDARVEPAAKSLDVESEPVKNIVKKITDVYGKVENLTHYGTFLKNSKASSKFVDYIRASRDEEEFMVFSREFMSRLKIQINGANSRAATGGYVIFCDYNMNGVDYIFVVIVKEIPGYHINAELSVDELLHVDVRKIHQAVRVNIATYNWT